MFKGKVYFTDETMEYVVVAGYSLEEVCDVIENEFFDKEIADYDFERVSDAPQMVVVNVDAYDAIEVE